MAVTKIGIPYAMTYFTSEGSFANGTKKAFALCPICEELIELVERKDYESFSGKEYAEHYAEWCAPHDEDG